MIVHYQSDDFLSIESKSAGLILIMPTYGSYYTESLHWIIKAIHSATFPTINYIAV